MTAHLSFRVVAATPPLSSYDTARVSKRMLPSPILKKLGQWSCLLRGYVYVHFRCDPETCSPCYTGLCRWASKGNVSLTSCHPSYMALAFCHGGTCTRKCVRPFAGHAQGSRSDPYRLVRGTGHAARLPQQKWKVKHYKPDPKMFPDLACRGKNRVELSRRLTEYCCDEKG